MRYCIVDDSTGKVENIIEIDLLDTKFIPSDGKSLVQSQTNENIGDNFDKTNQIFTKQIIVEDLDKLRLKELHLKLADKSYVWSLKEIAEMLRLEKGL